MLICACFELYSYFLGVDESVEGERLSGHQGLPYLLL